MQLMESMREVSHLIGLQGALQQTSRTTQPIALRSFQVCQESVPSCCLQNTQTRMLRKAARQLARCQHQIQFSSASLAAAAASNGSLPRPPEDRPSLALALLSVLGGSVVLGASLLPEVAAAEAAAPGPVPEDPYARPAQLRGVPREIILYQYEVCPFCNKVKAFLDYHKLPYRTVEVSPLTKSELKWSDYRKVPIVLLDQEPVGDSTAVLTRLSAELGNQPQTQQQHSGLQHWASSWWSSEKQRSSAMSQSSDLQEEERWRRWVDDRLVKVVTVNIYRSLGESFQTFKYINETGKFGVFEGPATRTSGAVMMAVIARRLVKKYGIQGDLRQELYAVAAEWVEGLQGRRYMGGQAPNLADLSAFGVIRSITGTDTFMDLMHETAISEWYEHMMGAVGDSARIAAS